MFRQEEVWVEVQGMKMWKVESMFRQGVVWGWSEWDTPTTVDQTDVEKDESSVWQVRIILGDVGGSEDEGGSEN